MDIQRLRNLTTGRLHTKIDHVYEDLEIILGENGLMTHQLPGAAKAVKPWLREHVTEQRFWDGRYDPSHTGDYVLPEPSVSDRAAMLERCASERQENLTRGDVMDTAGPNPLSLGKRLKLKLQQQENAMKGVNELILNQATVVEAVQHWLNAQMVEAPKIIAFKYEVSDEIPRFRFALVPEQACADYTQVSVGDDKSHEPND